MSGGAWDIDPLCFCPETLPLIPTVLCDGWLVIAGWPLWIFEFVNFCELLNFFHSPLNEGKQMDCRDVSGSCIQERTCYVKKANRGEGECPLLPPDKSISVLSEMAVEWELWDFSLLKWSSLIYIFSSLHIGIFLLCKYLSKVFTWSVGLKVISIFFPSLSLVFFPSSPSASKDVKLNNWWFLLMPEGLHNMHIRV